MSFERAGAERLRKNKQEEDKKEPVKAKKAPKPLPSDYIRKAAEVKKVAVED